MAIVDFPNIKPQKMKLGLSSNSKSFTSNFNQSVSAVSFSGDHFILSMEYSSLDFGPAFSYDEVNVMENFIFNLRGIAGVAKIPMFNKRGKPARGNPVVSESDLLGGELSTSGWAPGALVLSNGDYITVNDELKRVMSDVVADSSGSATVAIAPWLRSSPAIGTEIITQDPYGLFRVTSDEQAIDLEPMNGSVSFEFREAFYV